MRQARVALVTGGSRGIGEGIAFALAGKGIRVALSYHHNRKMARKVVEAIRSAGGDAIAVQLGLEDCASIEGAVEEVRQEWDSPDILVNNAAIAQERPFEAITDKDWHDMMAVNLGGPFLCCQKVLPHMRASGWGRIINISSIGGQWGGYNQVHYAASKAGLISLTCSLARLYSGLGITSNAVAPGLVQTDMSAQELSSQLGEERVRSIPIGRTARVDEIADVVAFLASDAAAYITGQTINVNGGMYFG